MHRHALIVLATGTLLAATLLSAPTLAVTAKDKMATCKFGADDQKLKGAARTKFMKSCMSTKNDPRGMATPDTPPSPPKQ